MLEQPDAGNTTYVVLRRSCWREPAELNAAVTRSAIECDLSGGAVRWLRSYVLAEPGGDLSLLCVVEASNPDAIRAQSYRAGLPVDEIVPVTATITQEVLL